jgi:7,8-dihydropterin-6-yl-methyl-4-(beta-D-ribofuranosyl)aminobenzene 5'-phosphate synthase
MQQILRHSQATLDPRLPSRGTKERYADLGVGSLLQGVLKKIVATVFCLTFLGPCAALAGQVQTLKVTVLSTMLADQGLGEWGYSALVEVDGRKFLFDTGANPDVVLKNAKSLGINLADVEDVVISHNHDDHTGGLITLRRELMKENPRAMSRAHVSANIFLPRLKADGSDDNGLSPLRTEYERLGGRFALHEHAAELAKGVWFSGPVPRKYPETNWSTEDLKIHTATGEMTDNVPEDAALVFSTSEGLVVLTGCGHAGIVNISEYAQEIAGPVPVFAVIGGLHLFAKSDEVVDWTAAQLRRLGVRYLLAGHCTGIEATWRLRSALGLTRKTAPVSSVGSNFILGKGIQPGNIAA